ncbi:DUF4158 domain-containing protein [Actinomadura soli]|uniref:DUF4158 domain-containing protein n=1 Tax=Actinomadura soli TaxID=2508997 RepID=UPI002E313688|nr:DUF4158 domain-containing protein [Actinomadura soli]
MVVGGSGDLGELVEHWTLLDDERGLVAGKRDATRLGLVVALKFYIRHGRFPRGRVELSDDVVEHVALQVQVEASELGLYDWSGRTARYHQMQIRGYLGFRECSREDADKLAAWLAAQVCEAEQRHDPVRVELLARCRTERIEPPTSKRVDRTIRSALRTAEQNLTARITARLPDQAAAQHSALVLGVMTG